MRKNNLLILIFIIVLALFLRFWRLGSNPPSLSWDEAAWGYNAYSLGLTGADEFGRRWPLNYLESFGDFKPPVYAYLTILPVKLFGLNEFATRFTSAFFGTLTVLFTYFLAKEIFDKFKWTTYCSLFAAFLLAISPWHIMLSRAAFEANVANFFLVAGVTFFLVGIKKKAYFLLFSAIVFALSLSTFNTARIVTPLLVLGLGIAFRKKLWAQKAWSGGALLLGIIVIFPAASFFLTPQARLRFREVNIFSNAAIVGQANQEMANDNWAWWSRIIHNRRWNYAREYVRHYFDHFNPGFLFFKGDGNPKFSTQDVGQLYLWELPFLILGCLLLFKKKEGYWWLVPCWLLAGIIPAATARETPHALRIAATLPTWQILIAFGVVGFLEWFEKIKLKKALRSSIIVFIFSLLVLNLIYFQHGYWRHYPIKYSGEWQYGYKPAIEFIKEVESEYDEIRFTNKLGRPYIYFLFYLQKDPQEFWQEAEVEREVFGFVKVKNFGKYHFPKEIDVSSNGRVLCVDMTGNVPQGATIVQTFHLLDGREVLKAFEI